MNKRTARNRVKADALDNLSQMVVSWDPPDPMNLHGLSVVEWSEVMQELSNELYGRALRLTPRKATA